MSMFNLYKNNRKVKSFRSYEKARSYARMMIRAHEANQEVKVEWPRSNPAISFYGYTIRGQ